MLQPGTHTVTVKQLRAILNTALVGALFVRTHWGSVVATRKAVNDALDPANRATAAAAREAFNAKLVRIEVIVVAPGGEIQFFIANQALMDAAPEDAA